MLGDFHSFIRANAQILSRFPGLVLQQALNEPDESCCSTMAQVRINEEFQFKVEV